MPALAEVLETVARRAPRADAILSSDRPPLSYGDLLTLVTEATGQLAGLGLGRADTVAVAVANGPLLATSVVAVACTSGCAPLNPALPEAEAFAVLGGLSPGALLIEEGADVPAARAATALGIPIIQVELGTCAGQWGAVRLPATSADPAGGAPSRTADVAIRLYTSGTIAEPKLVPLTHDNLTTAASNVVDSLQLTPADRCLNVMPLFHSHGLIGALLSTLSAGGAIFCAERLDPRRINQWAGEARATWTTAAPALHRAALSAPGEWKGYRLLRSASSAMAPQLASALEAKFEAPVIEVYGMTEAYQIAANPLPPGERRLGSVGRPTGTEVAVLHDGVVHAAGNGELVVRGPSVFGGYESPPGANDDAFVDGWFRTGDVGAIGDDGYIRVTGRLKEIINRGGEKISPRQIDEVLLDHPSVADVLCFGVPDAALGEEIAAAVVPTTPEGIDSRELRRFTATRLMATKVPRHFITLDRIPTGTGGKPRRLSLSEEYAHLGDQVGRPERTSPAAGDLYEVLAAMWSEILELDHPPEPDDTFFDLGGSSLAVVGLVVRIEDDLGVELPLDDVLELPTLREMAEEVEALVEGRSQRVRRHLRQMRSGVDDVVVVLIPGAYGVALGLQPIADRVRDDVEVLGFRYPGLLRGEKPRRSIDRITDALEAELDEIAAGRPIVLYGNSLGSWVAYELARRLDRRGHRPIGLVLGDLYSPSLGRGPRVLRRVARRLRGARRSLTAARAARSSQGLDDRQAAVLASSRVALTTYPARRYAGDVTLVVSEDRLTALANPTYGWDDLVAGSIDVVQVPGGHSDLHIVNADSIAAQLDLMLPPAGSTGA